MMSRERERERAVALNHPNKNILKDFLPRIGRYMYGKDHDCTCVTLLLTATSKSLEVLKSLAISAS